MKTVLIRTTQIIIFLMANLGLGQSPCFGRQDETRSTGSRLDASGDPLPERAISRIGTLRLRPNSDVESCAFSEDGKTLLSLSRKGTLCAWNLATGRQVKQWTPSGENDQCRALSPDGSTLAVVDKDHVCRFIDVSTGLTSNGFASPGKGLYSFFSGGKLFGRYTATSLQLWTTATGQFFPKIGERNQAGEIRLENAPSTNGPLRSFDVSGNGLLAASYVQGPIHLWDLVSGKLLKRLTYEGESASRENDSHTIIALSPDGKYLIAQNSHCRLLLFDTGSGKQLEVLRGPGSPLHGFVASDAKTLVAWSACHVHCWDLESRQILRPVISSPAEITAVALSKSGTLLAVATANQTLMLFDAKTGNRLHADSGPEDPSMQARFLSDGKIIAAIGGRENMSCGALNGVRYLDSITGKRVEQFDGRCRDLACISADGLTLALGMSSSIQILPQGRWFGDVARESPSFKSFIPLALSPNGKTLV